jgi:nucleotide-binding universal stress UspA family protein
MSTVETPLRIRIENILFATDFSTQSERALQFALALAKQYSAKIIVVHAAPPEPHYAVPMEPIPLELDPMLQESKQQMQELAANPRLHAVRHECIVEQGDLWNVVDADLAKYQTDMLVLATHGRHGVSKVVFGSDAESIFRRASCPVLTVGPQVGFIDERSWQPKKIVFATDFSNHSRHALPYALHFAEQHEAELTLLHLSTLIPLELGDDMEATLLARLRELVPSDAAVSCKAKFMIRFEFPAEGILRVAEESGADLIVMSVRRSALAAAASHLPWAIASEVVSRAACPVLTVRGG